VVALPTAAIYGIGGSMTTFSAGPQAIGYLYQARMALAVLLGSTDEVELRVEALDDIELTDAVAKGSLSLMQLKHHTGAAKLTDASTDLWKSLRVWAEQAKENKFALDNVKILLLTTATVEAGSTASLLGRDHRNITEAEKRLLHIADTSTNKGLRDAFSAFKALTQAQRKMLLSAITIVGSSPDINEIKVEIQRYLRSAVTLNHLTPFQERVEGWWFDKVILQLLAKSPQYKHGITGFDLHEQTAQIADAFREENLPIDFDDFDVSEEEVATSGDKQYVMQLKTIAVNTRTVRKAILDYHKAYHQRHLWSKDGLILPNELQKFERRLVDEWERYCDLNHAKIDTADPTQLIKVGQAVLRWAEQECDLRIRAKVEAPYIRRGSFHMLADRSPPAVYWHPMFDQLMKTALKAAA
jgi:hypothetical protein